MTPEELLKINIDPANGGQYYRIRFAKEAARGAQTVYFRAMAVVKGGMFLSGFEIDKDTLTEKGCNFVANKETGVEEYHETTHLIHHACIAKMTPLFNDIKYGGLTPLDIPAQKKKYGY